MNTILHNRPRPKILKYVASKLKDILMPVLLATRSGLQKQVLDKSLDYVSGLESPLINPDKLLNDKGKNLQLYDTMMLDDRISSIVNLKKKMTLSVNGEFVPASDDPKDVEVKDWIQDVLENMTIRWWDVFDNWLDAMVYGFKVGEKVFAMEDARIVLKTIKFKHSIFFDSGYGKYGELDEVAIGRH